MNRLKEFLNFIMMVACVCLTAATVNAQDIHKAKSSVQVQAFFGSSWNPYTSAATDMLKQDVAVSNGTSEESSTYGVGVKIPLSFLVKNMGVKYYATKSVPQAFAVESSFYGLSSFYSDIYLYYDLIHRKRMNLSFGVGYGDAMHTQKCSREVLGQYLGGPTSMYDQYLTVAQSAHSMGASLDLSLTTPHRWGLNVGVSYRYLFAQRSAIGELGMRNNDIPMLVRHSVALHLGLTYSL